MELMPLCSLWMLFLEIMCASADEVNVKNVKVGEPVTLPCSINVEDHVESSEIEWRTPDYSVLTFDNGKFNPGCDFKDRVQMSENTTRGNFSLTISPTWFSDYNQYECLYKRKHLESWTLQIIATIPKELTVTVGKPVWIPCYTRLKKCIGGRNRELEEITFNWFKDQQVVLKMKKGGKSEKGRIDVSTDINKGNLSLVLAKAYFSDSGTYECSEQQDSTVLKLQATEAYRRVWVGEYISLPLYSTDPVNVYVQRDGSSKSVQLCDRDLKNCSNSWTHMSNTQTIDLESVTVEDFGIYTVIHRKTNQLICTFNVTNSRSYVEIKSRSHLPVVLVFGTGTVIVIVMCIDLYCCKSRISSKSRNLLHKYLQK